MILSISFSKPAKNCQEVLGRPYIRARIRRNAAAALRGGEPAYDAEFFTEKQAFQRKFSEEELEAFFAEHAGTTFRSAVMRTDSEEVTVLANRRGEKKELRRPLQKKDAPRGTALPAAGKRRILQEGTCVPFLLRLGVMTADGKVAAQRYDKFRQINRFLEFVDDILPDVERLCAPETGGTFTAGRPLRIADFGCGKSYLTFAVYYFLHELRHIPVEITGLDLKEDVIAACQKLAEEYGYGSLHFSVGDIAGARYEHEPDIIITLHACDTATDYALRYAVEHRAKAILSVPCCQHELNAQLEGSRSAADGGKAGADPAFASLLRYGIIRERFAALATDAIRAELLEQEGYAVQVLEFIDMEHTPKNLLIRAVLKDTGNSRAAAGERRAAALAGGRATELLSRLGVSQTLRGLLQD